MSATQRPIRTAFLPYALPSIGEEEIAEVVDTLRSGWLTTGPKVKRFEDAFAASVGAAHAIAVNSNTVGLTAALAAHDVGPGDEVLLPSLTFCATANVVVHLGATPVLCECGEDGNLDVADAASRVTERTRAIMPVHYGGQAADLDAVRALAARHGLAVIEDAAHAAGIGYRGVPVGTGSPATVFSFYATKNLTTGEGGMITTDDDALAARLRRLVLHGMSRDAWKRYSATGSWYYEVLEPGFKANMTDLQASLGLHQLDRLPSFNARRAAIASRFDAAFADLPLTLPVQHPDRDRNWHLYHIRLRLAELGVDRDAFIDVLRARQIGTSVHYVPVHMHPYYRDRFGYRPEDLPATAAFYAGLLSLPCYPRMTDDDVADVIDAVRAACEGVA